MDEAKFLYFSALIKYSMTNKIIICIIKIIEIFPILMDFLTNPLRIKYYYIGRVKSFSSNTFDNSILKDVFQFSYFKKFRELRNSKGLFPVYFLIIDLIILFFYNIFYFLIYFSKKMSKSNVQTIKKQQGISPLLKMLFFNFYDHFVFRCFSLFFYDIIINFLCKSDNYYVLIILLFIFFYVIYLNLDYFNSFRLCIKFDLENKYIFDEKFIFSGDYCLTFLKIFISLEYNIDEEKMCHFFDLLIIIIVIIGIFKFFKGITYNIIGIFYGFFFISFLCFFILNILSSTITDTSYIFILYVFLSLLIPFLIIYKTIKKKYNLLVRTPIKDNNILMIQKFELLYEYYQTPLFDYILKNICFNSKIREGERAQFISKNSTIVGEDETIILNNYEVKKSINNIKDTKQELNYIALNKFSTIFKENSEHPNCDKKLNSFYYYISKIFSELMSDSNNYFKLIFQIRKLLNQLKLTNYIYYINLRYYYQILCQKHSFYDNNDMLLYNESLFKIFDVIILFVEDLEKFLSADFSKNPIDFISFSKTVSSTEVILKYSYQNLIECSIKNEYQKIILRVILEGLLNKIFSLSGTMLVTGDIGMYDEILDKYYNNEKVLKIKINLNKKSSTIVKVGRDLNVYWYKPFESLIPQEFQKIGIEKFFNDEPQDNNITRSKLFPQKFHFIVWNKDHDLKQFVYEYGIYPKLEDNVAFVDGNYKLGKDILIVTKKYIHSSKEIIFILSDSLKKIMYINQSLLTILNRYNISLEINEFLQDSNSYMYDLTKYCSYIYGQIKKLESMCNPEEIIIVNELIEHLNDTALIRSARLRYQFVYLFSIFDKNYEYCFYSIKHYKNKNKGIAIRKEKSIINWQLKDEDFQSASKEKSKEKNMSNFNTIFSSIAFDTKSQASQESTSSTLFSVNTSVGRKKINPQNNNNNRNYIIIIFNCLLIIVAIFCLIYENYVNTLLEKKMHLYKTAYVFNRFILNLMNSYLSLLNICDEDNNCKEYLSLYISKFEEFNGIEEIIYKDMFLKLDKLTSLFNDLKTEVEKSGVKEIEKYSSTLTDEIYLSYVDDVLTLNKLSPKRFDYLMKTFINKIIMTTNNDFYEINIYRMIVDENYNPVKILMNDKSIKFSETQLYTYEILFTYLDYSNHFYALQEEIEKNSDKQLNFNKTSLVIFIIALIFSNIFIMMTCLLLLKFFHGLIDKKIAISEGLLKNQMNIDKLLERIKLIKDLVKFYSKPPIDTLNKLSENMKKHEKKKHKSESSIKNEDINENEILGKYSLLFLIKKYLILILSMTLIYITYSLIFMKIAENSSNKLKNAIKIIENSAYGENLTYMMVGLIQLLQFIKLPEVTLYEIFHYLNLYSDKDFFSDLYSHQQKIFLLERREKELGKSFKTDAQILNFNCDTFFHDIKNDRFNTIIEQYPEKNYLQQMINFCKHIKIMSYSNEEIYLDMLYFSIMKLLLINSDSDSDFPDYNVDHLSELIAEILIIYRPLKLYLDNYYLDNVLKKELKSHFYTLVFFLLGNIILEIIFFIIIKFSILDDVDNNNKNLNKLLRILKVI